MAEDNYNLVCQFLTPFLTDDPVFARGVEFGMLYARMKAETEITDYFTVDNQEQILLLANRLKWTVETMRDSAVPGWFFLRMEKKP